MFQQNAIIVAAVSAQNFAARMLCLPKKGQIRKAVYDDKFMPVAGSAEECAIQVMTRTLSQYRAAFEQNVWAGGHLAFVLPTSVAIRSHMVRGLLKAGVSPEDVGAAVAAKVSRAYQMPESMQDVLSDYAEQLQWVMETPAVTTREEDSFNLRHFRVVGDDLKAGQKVKFVNTTEGNQMTLASEDGNIVCEVAGDALAGEHEIVEVRDGRKTSFAIEREANTETRHGKRLMLVQKLWSAAMDLLPADVDFDKMDIVNEAENTEEDVEEDVDFEDMQVANG